MEHTTNNQAELFGAIQALLAMPRGTPGILYLDSEYVVRAVNEWRPAWQANGWKNAKGQGIANFDLFAALFDLVDARPGVTLEWVRGHAGDELNELVDRLARSEAEKAKAGLN